MFEKASNYQLIIDKRERIHIYHIYVCLTYLTKHTWMTF